MESLHDSLFCISFIFLQVYYIYTYTVYSVYTVQFKSKQFNDSDKIFLRGNYWLWLDLTLNLKYNKCLKI